MAKIPQGFPTIMDKVRWSKEFADYLVWMMEEGIFVLMEKVPNDLDLSKNDLESIMFGIYDCKKGGMTWT